MTRPLYFCPQPKGSNLCGQCCVAMLLDISLDEAVELVGKRGLTRTKDLRAALTKKGWGLGPRINAKKHDPQPKSVYLARVHWENGVNHTHWILINAFGKVVDPGSGFDLEEEGPYITSYYKAVGPTDSPPA